MSHKSSPERDVLTAALPEQMRRQLEHSPPDDAAAFDQIEDAAGKIGCALSQEAQRRLAQQRTRQPRPPKRDCACGAQARCKGQQARTLVTSHGPLTHKRAYCHCRTCKRIVAPLDAALHLDSGSTTTQVRLWVASWPDNCPLPRRRPRCKAPRRDQVGMHWRQGSAEAIVALRAAQLSTCPPDLRPYCAMPA